MMEAYLHQFSYDPSSGELKHQMTGILTSVIFIPFSKGGVAPQHIQLTLSALCGASLNYFSVSNGFVLNF